MVSSTALQVEFRRDEGMGSHRKSGGSAATISSNGRTRLNAKTTVKIVADMAGDLFHAGHVAFLTKIRKLFPSAHLTVWLATDEQILSYKGRLPVMSYDCRKAVLKSCRLVDDVAQAPDVYTSAALSPFDYLCHGDDLLGWDDGVKERFYGAALREDKLVTVPYTKGISTTYLIERCKKSS
jgi:glycerol-3-phosphate cytidylyltransferase